MAYFRASVVGFMFLLSYAFPALSCGPAFENQLDSLLKQFHETPKVLRLRDALVAAAIEYQKIFQDIVQIQDGHIVLGHAKKQATHLPQKLQAWEVLQPSGPIRILGELGYGADEVHMELKGRTQNVYKIGDYYVRPFLPMYAQKSSFDSFRKILAAQNLRKITAINVVSETILSFVTGRISKIIKEDGSVVKGEWDVRKLKASATKEITGPLRGLLNMDHSIASVADEKSLSNFMVFHFLVGHWNLKEHNVLRDISMVKGVDYGEAFPVSFNLMAYAFSAINLPDQVTSEMVKAIEHLSPSNIGQRQVLLAYMTQPELYQLAYQHLVLKHLLNSGQFKILE